MIILYLYISQKEMLFFIIFFILLLHSYYIERLNYQQNVHQQMLIQFQEILRRQNN